MDKVLDALAALVVKQGVGLGLLPERQRAMALALVWRGLPAAQALSEREVNEALKTQLHEGSGAAAFLATDHVELRRWLVDTGWLVRDGYGREYRRVEPVALADAARALASALSIIEPAAWCAGLRSERAAERERKRAAWHRATAADEAGRQMT